MLRWCCVWCVRACVCVCWERREGTVCTFKTPLRVSIQIVPACTDTTRTHVSTCARGARTHGDILNRDTEGVLNLHTEVFSVPHSTTPHHHTTAPPHHDTRTEHNTRHHNTQHHTETETERDRETEKEDRKREKRRRKRRDKTRQEKEGRGRGRGRARGRGRGRGRDEMRYIKGSRENAIFFRTVIQNPQIRQMN